MSNTEGNFSNVWIQYNGKYRPIIKFIYFINNVLLFDCLLTLKSSKQSLYKWQTQGKQYKIYHLQNYTRNFNLIQD